jgi:hypothetical protein
VKTFTPDKSFEIPTNNGDIVFYEGNHYYSIFENIGVSYIQNIMLPDFWMVYVPVNTNGEVVGDQAYYTKRGKFPEEFFSGTFLKSTLKEGREKTAALYPHGSFSFNEQVAGVRFLPLDRAFKTTDKNVAIQSFVTQLSYIGKQNNTIRIVYREYNKYTYNEYVKRTDDGQSVYVEYIDADSNQLIKSPFTQEITYDLNETNIIRYQNFRIEILDATNEFVEYRVLSDEYQ